MASFLIADDSLVMRGILRYMVEKCGHRVIGEAKDGEEAVEMTKKHRPNAVTLDMIMRGSDTISALKQIKLISNSTKIFAVVEESQKSEQAQAEQSGADGVLYKPFELEPVTNELKRVLG